LITSAKRLLQQNLPLLPDSCSAAKPMTSCRYLLDSMKARVGDASPAGPGDEGQVAAGTRCLARRTRLSRWRFRPMAIPTRITPRSLRLAMIC
jgi:hypothetical protein